MKVLLTGAKGQVGSEIITRAQRTELTILAAGHAELDITSDEAVNEYFTSHSPDIVINAAAYTAVDKAEDEIAQAFAVNRDGPSHLAKACAASDIPLLHISTDYVFDGSKTAAYLEEDTPKPASVYGRSKLEGELAVASQLDKHIILRTAWVFGASGNNFVRSMLRLGAERNELQVVADQHGAPTWAGDIADALLAITKSYQQNGVIPWGTYHYIGSPDTSWHGFAQAIFEQAQLLGMLEKQPKVQAITTEQYPTPAQRPKNSLLDCQKINRAFGISQPDWRIGLRNVLNRWKQA